MRYYHFKDILGGVWVIPGNDPFHAKRGLRDVVRLARPNCERIRRFVDGCEIIAVTNEPA